MSASERASLPRSHFETVFTRHLGEIRRTMARICSGHRLDPSDAADFVSWALLRIMENDYAILRAHRGRGSLKTYLQTVLRNLFRDYRNHLWGKWRPSACAERLGPLAVRLERLIHRDGFEVEEAIGIVANQLGFRASRTQLENLVEQLPRRPVRRQESYQDDFPAADGSPSRVLEDRDYRRASDLTGSALERALAQLPSEDQRILHLFFAKGLTMAAIARELHLEQRSLYTRRDRCLGRLRRSLEGEGLGWREVQPIIGQETGMTVFDRIAC